MSVNGVEVYDNRGLYAKTVDVTTLDTESRAIIAAAIVRGTQNDITLLPNDFRMIDGTPTLDGTDPTEWLDLVLGVDEDGNEI